MCVDDGADARVERDAVEVFEPRDAHAFEAAVERAREECAGFVDGERRAGIGAGDGAEGEGEIGDGAAEASGGAEGGPAESDFGIGHAADGRTEADDVAEGGGIAEGAAGVGAAGDGNEAAGEGDGGAAGGSTAGFGEVVGIAGRAEDTVEGLGAGTEFGRVGFAEGDGSGARMRATRMSSSVGMLSL